MENPNEINKETKKLEEKGSKEVGEERRLGNPGKTPNYDITFKFFTKFFNFKIKIPVTVLSNGNINSQIASSFDYFGYQLRSHFDRAEPIFDALIDEILRIFISTKVIGEKVKKVTINSVNAEGEEEKQILSVAYSPEEAKVLTDRMAAKRASVYYLLSEKQDYQIFIEAVFEEDRLDLKIFNQQFRLHKSFVCVSENQIRQDLSELLNTMVIKYSNPFISLQSETQTKVLSGLPDFKGILPPSVDPT